MAERAKWVETEKTGTGKTTKFRRRKYLINPDFQLKLLVFFTGLAVVSVLVFYQAMSSAFNNLTTQAMELSFPPDHVFYQLIAQQRYVINLTFLTTSIFVFLFLVIGGLFLSHQVAGPLYRLHKHMEKVIQGGPINEVWPRKKDFFQDLFVQYNQMMSQLTKKK